MIKTAGPNSSRLVNYTINSNVPRSNVKCATNQAGISLKEKMTPESSLITFFCFYERHTCFMYFTISAKHQLQRQ